METIIQPIEIIPERVIGVPRNTDRHRLGTQVSDLLPKWDENSQVE